MKTMLILLAASLRSGFRLALLTLCLLPALCSAQSLYHVRIDTSPLRGRGTYVLDFQLLDGSSFYGNGNATVEITNFTLNGGALGTTLPPYGHVSGNLQDTLILIDGSLQDGLSDFAREFSVTSSQSEIRFDLRLSSTAVDAPLPDTFALLLLDSSLMPLLTTGPFGIEMVSADFTTTTPTPVGYSTLEAPLLTAVVTQATPGLSSVTLDTFQTCGTLSATGTVKLNTPAPTGGTLVTLSSNRPTVASVPPSVTVLAGQKSATFPVQTYGVAFDQNATLTAQTGSVSRTVTLLVQPLLQSLTLSATAACGAQSLLGTLTLRRATSQETLVQLGSGHPGVSLPASVSVPANQMSVTFPVTTANSEAATEVMLHASVAGATQSAALFVIPDPMYTFTDLGTLGGQNSRATGINASGQVVGYSDTPWGDVHAFLYQNGSLTDLDTLGGQHSYAYAVNAEGVAAGRSETSWGDTRAFLYAGGMTSLSALGGQHSAAYALNTYGQSAGDAQTAQGDTRAFLRRFETLLDLGTLIREELPNAPPLFFGSSRALGLSDTGQVVGESETDTGDTHAFLWQDGSMMDIGTLGGRNSVATAISASGAIAGHSETAGGDTHAFFYRNSAMIDLGTPGGQHSSARALNRQGQVVGTGQNALGDEVAFLACEGMFHDLNTRVANAGGWRLTEAAGINDRGQIVGKATDGWDSHAFLLTPIPPAQPLPVVSGMVTLEDCVQGVQPLTFTFRSAQGVSLFQQTQTLRPDGSFTLLGIPAGVYQMAIRGDRWLQRVVGVNTTQGNVGNITVLLQGGDANGDNSVDVLDLDLLIQAFDSQEGTVNWIPRADFNCDLAVDVLDLDILIRNFDQAGEE